MDSVHEETHAGAEHFCRTIRPSLRERTRPTDILVAGCGRGHEALYIRKELDANVHGVDVAQHWAPPETWGADIPNFDLQVSSVLNLPFADDSFDYIFYHHVIEHVEAPLDSILELRRVLRAGGLIYIGTPNRHRAVGYLGSFDAGLRQKLAWNFADYKARLKGQFRNEIGAHAGFSERELTSLLRQADYSDIEVLTGSYLKYKYEGKIPAQLLAFLVSNPVRGVAAPSVYFTARVFKDANEE